MTGGGRRRRGRAETALDRELRHRRDIGEAERAHLRLLARGLDQCEAEAFVAGLDALSKTYLAARLAAGLSVQTRPEPRHDPFDELLAQVTGADVRDAPDTRPAD